MVMVKVRETRNGRCKIMKMIVFLGKEGTQYIEKRFVICWYRLYQISVLTDLSFVFLSSIYTLNEIIL